MDFCTYHSSFETCNIAVQFCTYHAGRIDTWSSYMYICHCQLHLLIDKPASDEYISKKEIQQMGLTANYRVNLGKMAVGESWGVAGEFVWPGNCCTTDTAKRNVAAPMLTAIFPLNLGYSAVPLISFLHLFQNRTFADHEMTGLAGNIFEDSHQHCQCSRGNSSLGRWLHTVSIGIDFLEGSDDVWVD